MRKILLIESDYNLRESLQLHLEDTGNITVFIAPSKGVAMKRLSEHSDLSAVVVAARLNSSKEMNTADLVHDIRKMYPNVLIVGMSARKDYQEDLVSAGCNKSCSKEMMVRVVREQLGL